MVCHTSVLIIEMKIHWIYSKQGHKRREKAMECKRDANKPSNINEMMAFCQTNVICFFFSLTACVHRRIQIEKDHLLFPLSLSSTLNAEICITTEREAVGERGAQEINHSE